MKIDDLIHTIARLPGLGPRSARRVVLHLFTHRETVLAPLLKTIDDAAQCIRTCSQCGNLDLSDPCTICDDPGRDRSVLCIITGVGDLWALERAFAHRGTYHVLGGVLSALNGTGPTELNIPRLVARIRQDQELREIVFALGATVDGQTTMHYLAGELAGLPLRLTGLAHGMPVGGEVDYMDQGTLQLAFSDRRGVT